MDNKAKRFFASLQGKRTAFLGLGVSHLGAVRLFAAQGIPVVACDRRERAELGQTAAELEALGVEVRLGKDYLKGLEADIVFRTPGMYFLGEELSRLRRAGVVVTSEMEAFFDLCPCPILAVTGSDGKTTTATLIAEMLRAQGKTVHLGGNIGRALLPHIFEIAPDDYAAVELSSFQLISMRSSPETAVITNVTPNHLDVHGTMDEYTDAKRNLYRHQNAFSRTVLGADNKITASFAPEVRGDCMLFSLERPVEHGAFLHGDGMLYAAHHGENTPLLHKDEIRLPGIHNVANYLAAICAVRGLAELEAIRRVAGEFGGVEHRIEFVRELDGVRWYNDSIATSPTRAIAGLRSFDRKLIILAGGYDKKIPFEPLAPEVVRRVKLLILTGDTADQIERAVTSHPDYREGQPAILRASSMEEAVRLAKQHARDGDIVSLSPACASFDRYPNFEARGRHFKELVMNLEESKS